LKPDTGFFASGAFEHLKTLAESRAAKHFISEDQINWICRKVFFCLGIQGGGKVSGEGRRRTLGACIIASDVGCALQKQISW